MNIWELIFLLVVVGIAVKYRTELCCVLMDIAKAIRPSDEEAKRWHELKKTKVENGAFFDWNKFMRNLLMFGILFIGLFVVTFSQFSNRILQDNTVQSSMDFDTNVDMQFDGYFTQKITYESVKLDPDCVDTFDYLEYSYAIPLVPSTNKRLEYIKDEGWTQYYRKCIEGKEVLEQDSFVDLFENGLKTGALSPNERQYLERLLKERKEELSCNTTLILYKKNLKTCEREIIEVENPREFIPTNLTVNGISISGNGTGAFGNLVGVEMFSILSDLHWNFEDYVDADKFDWRD
jgi:hypothetical protein